MRVPIPPTRSEVWQGGPWRQLDQAALERRAPGQHNKRSSNTCKQAALAAGAALRHHTGPGSLPRMPISSATSSSASTTMYSTALATGCV
jgi:hypothetical protein